MRTSGARGLIAATVILAAAVVAAARMTTPPAPARSSGPSSPSAPAAAGRDAAPGGVASTTPAGGPTAAPAAAPATGAEADQMTFAYAATDLEEVSRRLQAVGGSVASLGSAADSYSIGAMRDAAERVRTEAEGLRAYAEAAHARLAPLSSADPVLRGVWTDALAAYTRTVTHADAALDLAGFALTLDPSKAAAAMESITSLGGGESALLDELATARSALDDWSRRNGSGAQSALARFGYPAA